MHPDLAEGATLPAAGLPWFMALFGRDSLITSFQALPYLPGLAATTLRVLAARQATVRDDFHEQEPGKILHELRFGELTARGERPYSPYFGSADATPLFLVLLDEYHRWSGDDDARPRARAQRPRRAGLDRRQRRPRRRRLRRVPPPQPDHRPGQPVLEGQLGLDPVRRRHARARPDRDLRDPGLRLRRPAALARASPARSGATTSLATQLERRAGDLRANFQRDFWMPERGCHALALDGDKRQVDSLTSNIGHLLWSGLLDDAEAAATAERLLDEQLYSGWGVRTLGAREAGYNPLGYHTGHGLAPRQLADRRRPRPLRVPRGGRRRSPPPCSPPRPTSSTACPRSSPAFRER